MVAALFACGACSTEDDVMEIFNDKTWKLTRLTDEGSNRQFYSGLWASEKEETDSRKALKIEGNFTVSFNLAEVNGQATGTAEARGIQASIGNAHVTIDAENRELTLAGKVNGSETDKLAKAFINGLPRVFKYEGDSNSLTLYFKDEVSKKTKVMGFTAQ